MGTSFAFMQHSTLHLFCLHRWSCSKWASGLFKLNRPPVQIGVACGTEDSRYCSNAGILYHHASPRLFFALSARWVWSTPFLRLQAGRKPTEECPDGSAKCLFSSLRWPDWPWIVCLIWPSSASHPVCVCVWVCVRAFVRACRNGTRRVNDFVLDKWAHWTDEGSERTERKQWKLFAPVTT